MTMPPEPPGFGTPEAGGPPGWGTPPGPGTPPGYGTPPGAPGDQPGYGTPQPPVHGGMPAPPGQWVGPPLAEWPMRAGGALIDAVISWVPYLILLQLSAGLAFLGSLGIFGYQMYLQGTTGQTIGKRVLKIRLLREADGQPVGVGLAIGRAFLHLVDAIPCGLGFLWPLWDAKKQTFADKIVTTVVIKA